MGLIVSQAPASMTVYHLSDAAAALDASTDVTALTTQMALNALKS